MKAVLFCRVSSKEQEETGYSLTAQEKLLKDYSKVHNFEIAKIFSISESASGKKQRQIFDSMVEFSKKQNIKIMICEKVDRLTRNIKDSVDINEWINKDPERQVHFVKENVVLDKDSKSNEKFIWNIKVAVAQYYIDNLSEEVKKGQKEKLAQGWLPTKPPLGYKTLGEKGRKIHVIDTEKAKFIKRMFSLYATGNYSVKKLAEIMAKDGMKSDYGNKVIKSRIHQYLTDPFYIGKNRWNGQLYPGKQEIFISLEIFEKVQKILKSKTTPKYRKHDFLFKSLIRCKECTGLITWEVQKGIVYGHCNHYRGCTQKIWFTEPQIEDQLIKFVTNLEVKNPRLMAWIRKALKESHKELIEYNTTSLNELNERFKTIEGRFEKIYDDKLDGKITEEFYNKQFKRYTKEKEEIAESLNKQSQNSNKFYQLSMNIYDLAQRAKEIYLKAKNINTKRQLIRLIFANLSINKGVLDYEYSTAFKVLHEAVKITNEATNGSKLQDDVVWTENIFELKKIFDITPQSDTLYPTRPVWLPSAQRLRTLFYRIRRGI